MTIVTYCQVIRNPGLFVFNISRLFSVIVSCFVISSSAIMLSALPSFFIPPSPESQFPRLSLPPSPESQFHKISPLPSPESQLHKLPLPSSHESQLHKLPLPPAPESEFPKLSLSTPPTTPSPKLPDSIPFPVCVCSRIFIPICASDGHTYDNTCHFECIRDHVEKMAAKTLHVVLLGEECPEPNKSKKVREAAKVFNSNFIPVKC